MPKIIGSISTYPARTTLIWYLGLVLAGTLALRHPWCHGSPEQGRPPLTLLDGLFTATSAACVTGLVVRSTAHDFSFLGQLVILLLIQLGGIGIMTVTTFIVFQLGSKGGLRQRALLTATLGTDARADLPTILRNVLFVTFFFEAIGCVLLTLRYCFLYSPFQALWHGLFHSVSAFCNAGFALHDDSLMQFRHDPVINLVIALLIMLGGIGFPVILDIKKNWNRISWMDLWEHLQLHTKIMLIGSVVLWGIGAAGFLLLEWNGELRSSGVFNKLQVSFFHSVSSRTAGFNTVDVARLKDASSFLIIVLMAIGAGACSTAGGFKVSSAAVLALRAWATFLGYQRVRLFHRTIPREAIERSMATIMLYVVVAAVAITSLLTMEQSTEFSRTNPDRFLATMFEVISALGTVGLSMGLTPELTIPGRIVIIFLMFLGRLGPISVFAALSRGERADPVEFPSEEPLVG